MKLWEVLKALDENPKKMFECDTGSKIKFFDNKLYWYDKHGNPKEVFEIRDKRSGSGMGLCHNTGDIWQEVKLPVPLQEAFEAWANGKRIRCVIGKAEYIFGRSPYREFQDQRDYGLVAEHITKGTWYIED